MRDVLITNYGHSAEFHHDSEHMGSNIGTAGVIAEVFRKPFLVAVRTRESRPYRDLRPGAKSRGLLPTAIRILGTYCCHWI